MARKSGGLGRDFYSLLDDNMPENNKNGVSTLRIADIEPRSDQPRKMFEPEALSSLAQNDALSVQGNRDAKESIYAPRLYRVPLQQVLL